MRKITVSIFVLLVMFSCAYAANFSPTLMKLSASDVIQYDFDGSNLSIPFTITGTPAGLVFCVFTKDQSESITNIQNGYLGWHYVNKVDTCIYYSSLKSLDTGNANIVWDGKDQDGNKVPAGEYTYYLWGFDNVDAKTRVFTGQNIRPNRGGYLEEYGPDGKPLTKPFILSGTWKWTLGNDPEDDTLRETTALVLPEGFGRKERPQMHPTDHNYFYCEIGNDDTGYLGIWKFQWVPNGDAVHVDDWGDDGGVVLPVSATGGHSNNWFSGVATDNDYLYVTHCNRTDPIVNFYYIDFDGSILQEIDISDWWANPDDAELGAQMTGGPNNIWMRKGLAYLNSHTSCLESVCNPAKGMDDEDSFWVWHNDNGDYVGDHNFEEDADKPWVCFDFNVAPYTYTISADENQFSMTPAYDMGAISFALYAPDGTGIDYLAYAGETAALKYGNFFVDTGSPYDGIYTDNASTGPEGSTDGLWYVAHDSIMGIISNKPVAVDDAAPASFEVAQNTPNPFNPATTINFSTAEAGNVSIDVFNIAGQKVATIANEYRNAGNHTVTWDASGFSAGVYFYTVKSGELLKTMKMTLLK